MGGYSHLVLVSATISFGTHLPAVPFETHLPVGRTIPIRMLVRSCPVHFCLPRCRGSDIKFCAALEKRLRLRARIDGGTSTLRCQASLQSRLLSNRGTVARLLVYAAWGAVREAGGGEDRASEPC